MPSLTFPVFLLLPLDLTTVCMAWPILVLLKIWIILVGMAGLGHLCSQTQTKMKQEEKSDAYAKTQENTAVSPKTCISTNFT